MTTGFSCPCCGTKEFTLTKILWKDLIETWGLNKKETDYINRQQGLVCNNCGSNLRSMTLAKAVLSCYREYDETLIDFLAKNTDLKILEINEAGNLTHFFENATNHTLVTYPEVKIEKLPYKDGIFDIVIHSDTLEHVKDPIKGLTETHRVLRPGGYTCFTIPLLVDRLSRRRSKAKPSYHGSPGQDEYPVVTEYGADMWQQVIEARFEECRLISLEYPSSIAITGLKKPNSNTQTTTKRSIFHKRRVKGN